MYCWSVSTAVCMFTRTLRFAVMMLSVALLGACGTLFQDNGNDLLVNGIGSNAYVDDTVSRAKTQHRYFELMCGRAGLNYLRAAAECDYSRDGVWREVVYAALNDIDERCNAYLDSLDDARRDREAYVAQLKASTSTANVIIALTGGASAKTLAILQAAFGLAAESLDIYYSRLIVEAEKSSVERMVLKRMTDFRQSLAHRDPSGSKLISKVSDKPAAYLVIRSYLRLCLPSTIEARINSSIDRIPHSNGNPVTQSVSSSSSRSGPALERLTTSAARRSGSGDATVYVDPDLQTLGTLRRR